jgi:citrate lyase beta subunit
MRMRSILVVPANSVRMIEKSFTLGSDQIIFDLEDSVILDEKIAARAILKESLLNSKSAKRISIRVNEIDSPESIKDIELISSLGEDILDSVILPKIDSVDLLEQWTKLLPKAIEIEVQIETARGLLESAHLAAHPNVKSLAFGPADFMASMGMPSNSPGTPLPEANMALQFPLYQMIMAAHAFGKLAYDGPYFHFQDSIGLSQSAQIAKALGADGKWAIHPKQIDFCNRIFTPSETEIARAEEIIAVYESSSGAANLAGLMIDKASLQVAYRLLQRANHSRK